MGNATATIYLIRSITQNPLLGNYFLLKTRYVGGFVFSLVIVSLVIVWYAG